MQFKRPEADFTAKNEYFQVYYYLFAGIALLVAAFLFLKAPVVFAQTEEQPQAAAESVAVTDNLEGITVAESASIPSNFGLWWRGLRERISVALTLDPVKKAEKQLIFAEERMNLAKVIMEKSTDPKIQEKAQTMLEHAEKFMAKVGENKDKWMANQGERAQRLLKNIATHEVRKEKILDVIEEKLPAEKQEQFQALREKVEQNSTRLMNAISNASVPEPVKAHLQDVKARIEAHATIINQYRDEKKELLQKIKIGDTAAKEEFKQLQAEKIEKLQAIKVEYKEKMQEFKENVQNKDVPAVDATVAPVSQ